MASNLIKALRARLQLEAAYDKAKPDGVTINPILERLIAVVEAADLVIATSYSDGVRKGSLRVALADLRAAVLPIAHETGKTKISHASGKAGK